jgi:hypothetical protein
VETAELRLRESRAELDDVGVGSLDVDRQRVIELRLGRRRRSLANVSLSRQGRLRTQWGLRGCGARQRGVGRLLRGLGGHGKTAAIGSSFRRLRLGLVVDVELGNVETGEDVRELHMGELGRGASDEHGPRVLPPNLLVGQTGSAGSVECPLDFGPTLLSSTAASDNGLGVGCLDVELVACGVDKSSGNLGGQCRLAFDDPYGPERDDWTQAELGSGEDGGEDGGRAAEQGFGYETLDVGELVGEV